MMMVRANLSRFLDNARDSAQVGTSCKHFTVNNLRQFIPTRLLPGVYISSSHMSEAMLNAPMTIHEFQGERFTR